MPRQAVPRPVTLGELIARDELLWIFCRACAREVEIKARAFVCPLSPETAIPEIAPRMRCRCGSRRVSVRGEVVDGGVVLERMLLRGSGLPVPWTGRREGSDPPKTPEIRCKSATSPKISADCPDLPWD